MAFFVGIALSGCAITYDGSDGSRHIVGLVDMQLAPTDHNATLAGQVVSVKSLGALVSSHDGQTTVGLGYTDETTAAIKNNVLVLGNPIQAVHSVAEKAD